MTPPKILFLDLDDTIIFHSRVSSRIIELLDELSGTWQIVPNTARPYRLVVDILPERYTNVGIYGLGSQVLTGTTTVLRTVNKEFVSLVWNKVQRGEMFGVCFETPDHLICDETAYHYLGNSKGKVLINSYTPCPEQVIKVLVAPGAKEEIEDQVEDYQLSYTIRRSHWDEILGKGIDKGSGVDVLCNLRGWMKSYKVGIGDGESDIPLFKAVDYSIGVARCSSKILPYVDLTLTNGNPSKAIEKFLKLLVS